MPNHRWPAPAELTPIFVREVRGVPALAWAEGSYVCIPRSVLTETGLADTLDGQGRATLTADLPRPTASHAEMLRLRNAFTDKAPTSARLPFSYHWVPGFVRHLVASSIGRWQRKREHVWATFPRWPLDLSSDFLADWASGSPAQPVGPTPVLLTHDLDSAEGIHNLVYLFLDREERRHARSTSFVVPCGWPLDHGLLREIQQRDHALGVHGYDHANRTSFVSHSERLERLDAGRKAMADYHPEGYRAPSLLRTTGLLEDLQHSYRYDSSIPTAGGAFPTPNNGCASARPFRLGSLIEIPLSLPRDGSLRFLGHTPREIADLWIQCARAIARSRGVVVLLTHCEKRFSGNPGMLEAYDAFLDFIASSPEFTWSTFQQVIGERMGEQRAAA